MSILCLSIWAWRYIFRWKNLYRNMGWVFLSRWIKDIGNQHKTQRADLLDLHSSNRKGGEPSPCHTQQNLPLISFSSFMPLFSTFAFIFVYFSNSEITANKFVKKLTKIFSKKTRKQSNLQISCLNSQKPKNLLIFHNNRYIF